MTNELIKSNEIVETTGSHISPINLWQRYQDYKHNKFIEKIMEQKGTSMQEVFQQSKDLEDKLVGEVERIVPVLKDVENQLNAERNWDDKTHYTLCLALPESEYHRIIKNTNLITNESEAGIYEYSFGIARLNGNGRTVRMLDPRENYMGENFENMRFGFIEIRKENIVKNGKKTSKEVYVISQGTDMLKLDYYDVSKSYYEAFEKANDRIISLAKLIYPKYHMDLVMTHPYLTNTPTRSPELYSER